MSTDARYSAVPVPVRLERLGRMPWRQARTLLPASTCAWADIDGFHILPAAELPHDSPHATHLWAWTANRCLRMRIDGTDALVAALDIHEAEEGSMHAYSKPGVPWPSGHDRVGPLPDAADSFTLEILELPGATPATFVRATG
jgi:hypothetical protein